MVAINNPAFDRLRRHSDSLLTKLFARAISAQVSIRLAKTETTPLQVTLASLFAGILAAYIGSKPFYLFSLAAAILMEISHVLDCVDGELARLTTKGNPFAASMDPISDRFKDSAVLIAAYMQCSHTPPFGISTTSIAIIALTTMGMWLCYMYIVDAFLNPARKKRETGRNHKRIYLGLYDLFIYGSIVFWLANYFNYFIFYVFILAFSGILIQTIRLKNQLTSE